MSGLRPIEALPRAAWSRPAPTSRELHDHPRTMLPHARLNLGKEMRVGRRRFVWIAHVNMHQGRTRFERLVRRFDLLRNGHRYSAIVLLPRNTTPVIATAMTTLLMAILSTDRTFFALLADRQPSSRPWERA